MNEQKDALQRAREEIDEVDRRMAELFVRRMRAVESVAAYKRERGLPILDTGREAEVLEKNAARVEDASLRPYYRTFLQDAMAVSKAYQRAILADGKVLHVDLPGGGYDVTVERGGLQRVGDLFPLQRKVLVVTDDGVPAEYAHTVAQACLNPVTVTLPAGEGSKSLETLEQLCRVLLENNFTRTDAVVAVGGGVVGDLAGFAAACYMRGIDFYNVPTTLLAQVDASVGGKTAVDLCGVKNCVGAFHQPKGVLVDAALLATLPPRQLSNGMAEVVKMLLLFDPELFGRLERESPEDLLDEMVLSSLRSKVRVVEQDERESGLRRVLNFGHTLGHGIESSYALQGLYHGECVALGMLPMCAPEVRARLRAVLEKLGLPTVCNADVETVLAAVSHDKKRAGDRIGYVYVSEVGRYEIRTATMEEFRQMVKGAWKE